MLNIGLIVGSEKTTNHLSTLKDLNEYFCLKGVFLDASFSDNLEIISSLYKDSYDLIDDVDCVLIVSEVASHYELSSYALKRGKHLFVESPIAYSVEQAKKLFNLSVESGGKVYIGCEELFNKGFSCISDYIQRPFLIETFRKVSRNRTLDNIIYDWMLNDVQVALDLVRSGVKRISANAVGVYADWVDVIDVRVEFDNACVATIKLDATNEDESLHTYIYQKGHKIDVDFDQNRSRVVYPDRTLELINEETYNLNYTSKHYELIAFYNAILQDSTPKVSIENSIDALELTKKIMEQVKLLNPVLVY